MKKRSIFKKIMLAALALAVVLTGVIFAYAEPDDGVTVEWVTTKDSFDASEEIMLKLVINNGSTEEKRFTYSVEIPEEVGINSDTPYTGVFSIGKGISEELRYSRVNKSAVLPGGPGFTPSPNNPNSGNQSTDATEPQTSTDDSSESNVVTIILWVVLGLAVVGGVVFVIIKRRGAAAMIAIILCAATIIPMMAPLEINAANSVTTVSAIKTITVDGKEVTIKATLDYEKYEPKYTVDEDGVRVYEAEAGRVMFEAEDQVLPGQDRFVVKDHANASGGKVAFMDKPAEDNDGDMQPDYADYSSTLPAQMSFRFVASKAGNYAVWARMYASSTAISMITSPNNGKYLYTKLVEIVPEEGNFEWRRICSVECEEGDIVDIRIRTRHMNGEVDKFIITDNIAFVPKGEGTLPGQLYWDKVTEFETDKFADPLLYPTKGQHPRLMFTEADIPGILERFDHEDNENARIEFDKKRGSNFDGMLAAVKDGSNFNEAYLSIIEAKAFDYAIFKNSDNKWKQKTALAHGEEAVTAMINFLQTVTFSGTSMDYRYIGSTLFTAAEVYDWCYDLLDDKEKDLIVAGAQIQASMIEAGFPPTTTIDNAFMSHDAEYQIQQCWLAFGIAVADEYPSIYDFIGGMYFQLFLDVRNEWFPSMAYHQGSAYGTYRFDADLWGQWLIYQMTGGRNDLDGDGKEDGYRVFTEETAKVIYQWIYTRRPDGKIMEEGDDYEMTQTLDNTWFDSLKSVIFSVANFYRDPVLYQELLRENPGLKPGSATTIYSPTMTLILNDPSILDEATGNTEVSNLPLSRYLPLPYGGMVARTGWEWGLPIEDVVVSMQMSQRYLSGHQHMDTGSFQIYFKGLLSGDSGYYVLMGEDHDTDYYKLSVAHNTLSITSIKNPTGVQNEDFNVSDLLNDDPNSKYLRSKIVGQEFGPNIYTPDYTYIAGDIAGAYDENVNEAIRSMLFLNLKLDGNTKYPGAFIVFDQINTKEAGTTKSFLLHSMSKPTVEGNTITMTNTQEGYNGKLVDQVLYVGTAEKADAAYKINRIGGTGKEYWYDGANHPNTSSMADNMAYEGGWGRVEISTKTLSQDQTDYMLNVMYVTDAGTTEVVPATLIKGDGVMGAQILNHVAMFNMDGNNRISKTVTFTIPASAGQSKFKVNVAGLKEGTWTVTANGKSKDYVASKDGGMLYFEAAAGQVTITRKNNNSNKTFDTVDHREPVSDLLLFNVNGNYRQTAVKPVKAGDTVLIPTLETFKMFESKIERKGDIVTINYMNIQTIVIDVAKKTATVNGESVDISGMQISGDELMIPVEAIALFIGEDQGEAIWRERAKCVYIQAVAPVYIPEEKRDFNNVIQVENVYLTDEKRTGVDTSDTSGLVNSLDNSTRSYAALAGYLGEAGGVYDLGKTYTIDKLHFVFHNCETRIYTFEVLVSIDGIDFTPLSGGKRFKSAKMPNYSWQEYIMPEDTQARYVKLVGYGNVPDNSWFSWSEVAFVGVPIQSGEVIKTSSTDVYTTVGGSKVGSLTPGADVEVIRAQLFDGVAWAKIKWGDGYAWVRMADVALFERDDAKIHNTGKMVTNTTVWNMEYAKGTALGQIKNGTAIEIYKIEIIDSVAYAQIHYKGYQGWVRLNDLAQTADPDAMADHTGKVNAGGTKVYNRSSTSSIVMGTLKAGTFIEVYEIKDIYGIIYGRIVYDGLEAWINLGEATMDNPNPPFHKEFEAEDVTLFEGKDSSMFATDGNGKTTYLNQDVLVLTDDAKASGGKAVKLNFNGRFASGTINASTDLTKNPAHISFTVKADRSAPHYIWVRYSATTAIPTISSYIDGIIYKNGLTTSATGWQYDTMGDDDYNSIVTGDYVWCRLAICDWVNGQTYTVRLRGRDGGISYDKFVVTTDPGYSPSVDSELIKEDLDYVIEAENVTCNPLFTDVVNDKKLGYGKGVQLEKTYHNDTIYINGKGSAPAIGFKVVANKPGTYYVWGKFSSFSTLYASVAGYGNEYSYRYYKPDQKMEAKIEGWYLIGTYDVLEEGESIYVRLIGRNGTNIIDEFYVTTDSEFVGAKPHVHTYSNKWSKDDTYHWHASTCGHASAVSAKEEHVYDHDMDATCNTCGHVRKVHPHTYSTEWSKNERYHWHAATCGCTNKVSEKAYHTFGADKLCTVCGAEMQIVGDHELTYIEAEDVNLFTEKDTTFGHSTGPVIIADNAAASKGKVAQWSWTNNLAMGGYTVAGSTDLTAYPAHISFDVKALETGTYYIWARVSLDAETNIWSYVDGITYKGMYSTNAGTGWEYDIWGSADNACASESEFIWVRVAVCNWNADQSYSVRFRGRNGKRIVFDQFVVTMDNTFAPNQDDTLASFNNDTVIEAEKTTLDISRVEIVEDLLAGNDKYVNFDKYVGTNTPFVSEQGAPSHSGFQVKVNAPGTYYIWGKFMGVGTMFASISDSATEHEYSYYKPNTDKTPKYEGWYLIGEYEATAAGEIIYVRLIGRNGTTKIDQYYVTANADFVGFKPHAHSYNTAWSKDATNHWHAANCGHAQLIKDKGTHVYTDDTDATCNTCGYTRVVHIHTYSAEWSKNDTHHWHAATCGCTDRVADKAAHTFGTDKLCTTCGAPLVYVGSEDHTFIEAEDVDLFTTADSTYNNKVPVTIVTDSSAYGGKYIKLAQEANANYTGINSNDLVTYPAHISFEVKASATGTYYVWAKVQQSGANIWSYIDGITKRTDNANVQAGGWAYDSFGTTDGFVWVKIAVCSWEAGKTYNIRFRSRQAGTIMIDQFMVTSDVNVTAPHVHTFGTALGGNETHHGRQCTVPGCTALTDKAEHEFGSTGVCACGKVGFYTIGSSATYIEAENVNLFTGVDTTCGNCIPVVVDNTVSTASGNTVARWNWDWNTSNNKQSYVNLGDMDDVTPAHVSFDVKAKANETYYVWVKVSQKTGSNVVVYVDNDDNRNPGWQYLAFPATSSATDFVWVKVATCTADNDGIYSVRFRARNGGSAYFDQFVVTTDKNWNGQ